MAFRAHIDATGVSPGDEVALYVTRGAFHCPTRDFSQVVAVGHFGGSVTGKKVLIAGEEFPQSVPLRLGTVLPEREGMPFGPLVERMSFIVKKAGWGPYLRRALVRIPDEDMSVLRKEFDDFVARSERDAG